MKLPTEHLTAILAALPADTLRVPFALTGCVLHKRHDPDPASSELHHVFPLYLQKRKYGDVDPNRPATAHDKERIPVCGTGHSDVHLDIDAILAGHSRPKGVGRAEQSIAQAAISRFNAQ